MSIEIPSDFKAMLLLAACIKVLGKHKVLELPDVEVKMPFEVKLSPVGDRIALVLVEGQDDLDKWEQKLEVSDEQEDRESTT